MNARKLYPQVILARVAQEHDCRDGEVSAISAHVCFRAILAIDDPALHAKYVNEYGSSVAHLERALQRALQRPRRA